jgi:hypothetical protein
MIETAKKPFPEVLAALHGLQRIGIVGCDSCAKVCLTGGTVEVADMAEQLTAQGKNIIFAVAPERPCKVESTRPVLAPLQAQMQACDALLVLGCGAALQIIYHVTETLGLALPLKSGLKTLGPMEVSGPGEASPEQHQEDGAGLLSACLR